MDESPEYYECLHKILPRYLRIRDKSDESIMNKISDLAGKIHSIRWINGFLCLPGTVPISNLNPLQLGCYPMDIASAQAIVELFRNLALSSDSLKILDLCCCPGSKFQMMSDLVGHLTVPCTLVGVDISEHRMRTCKKLALACRLKPITYVSSEGKSMPNRVRQLLFLCDGTKFGKHPDECRESTGLDLGLGELLYDSQIADKDEAHNAERQRNRGSEESKPFNQEIVRKRMNKSARHREQLALKQSLLECYVATGTDSLRENYDYVLVDAECSHDGSYRHMRYVSTNDFNAHDEDCVTEGLQDGNEVDIISNKRLRVEAVSTSITNELPAPILDLSAVSSSMTSAGRAGYQLKSAASIPYTSPEKYEELKLLQRSLLQNGFRLMRRGGTLVYSTCSLEDAQNEDIVTWFLNSEPTAQLVPCISSDLPSIQPSIVSTKASSGTDTSCNQSDPFISELIELNHDSSSSEFERLSIPSILQLQPSALVSFMRSLSSGDSERLSLQVCKYIANLEHMPLTSGKIPGTLKLTKNVGMSGLFIAKFTKL